MAGMSGMSTAREAFIVETLGEVAALIDRVEAVAPALDASRRALIQASTDLAGQVAAFESRMAAITENAKVHAVKHIARRTDEIARGSAKTQTRAMEEAARMLFRTELGPTLQRLALPLQHLADLAQRGARPWQHWLTHAATAVGASAGTWALAAWWWGR
jgi:cell division septum initiation protein DivIVA